MAELTRRGFIKNTSAVGAAAVAGGIAAGQLNDTKNEASTSKHTGPLPESMVVHIRDFERAEVSLLVGTEEVVFRDVKLVDQLLDAAAKLVGR